MGVGVGGAADGVRGMKVALGVAEGGVVPQAMAAKTVKASIAAVGRQCR
jgi:hypothetical protein